MFVLPNLTNFLEHGSHPVIFSMGFHFIGINGVNHISNLSTVIISAING